MEDHFSRMLGQGAADDDELARKRARFEALEAAEEAAASGQPPSKRRSVELSAADIEEMLAKADEEQVVELNAHGVRSLCRSLSKRLRVNQEMRIQHPDDPMKFMESELDLDQEIKSIAAVAAASQLYPILVQEGFTETVSGLLTHENLDIVFSTVAMLYEITESEALQESNQAMELVDALMNQDIPRLLVQLLQQRLATESGDEATQAAFQILGVFDHLGEVPEQAPILAQPSIGLLDYLVTRIRREVPFDSSKLYASELLSVLLSEGTEVVDRFGAPDGLDGVDGLLMSIAAYRRKDPDSAEELEYSQNLFHCLCSALMSDNNRERFRRCEGLDLMQKCMKERKSARSAALKVVDYALTQDASSCAYWVRLGGLKQLFPAFMGRSKSKSKHKESHGEEEENEEHAVSIVASLVSLLPDVSTPGDDAFRVAAKFVENDFEKTDRLTELFIKYLHKVVQSNETVIAEGYDEDEDALMNSEEMKYLRRLDAGLFTLQRLTVIIARASAENPQVKTRVSQKLEMEGLSLLHVVSILSEYIESLGESVGAAGAAASSATAEASADGEAAQPMPEQMRQHKQRVEEWAAALLEGVEIPDIPVEE